MVKKSVSRKISPEMVGLLQAAGLTLYVIFIALLLNYLSSATFWVAVMNNFIGPLMFLLLFVISALVCALIVFTYPFYLAFNSKVKDAIVILLWTPLWLVLFGFITCIFAVVYPVL